MLGDIFGSDVLCLGSRHDVASFVFAVSGSLTELGIWPTQRDLHRGPINLTWQSLRRSVSVARLVGGVVAVLALRLDLPDRQRRLCWEALRAGRNLRDSECGRWLKLHATGRRTYEPDADLHQPGQVGL